MVTPRSAITGSIAVIIGLGTATGALGAQAISVASGEDHSCAIMQDTTVRCWGMNSDGQLGDGKQVDRPYPVPVAGLTGVVDVAPSRAHTCAVLSSGTVMCWGDGQVGQLGDGRARALTTPSLVPVTVSHITTATQVASGSETTCALLRDTTVQCWGRGDYGTRGDGSTINAGLSPVAVRDLTGVTAIIGGRLHMCALLDDQSLHCWGSNVYGELGDGTRTRRTVPYRVPLPGPVVSADGGATSTCAALADGSVYCWGGNDHGQLGTGASGTDQLSPVAVSGVSTALAVGLAHQAGCARLPGSVTQCWGHGTWNGGVGWTTTPVTVPGLAGAVEMSMGSNVSCATFARPSLKCWGSNAFGSVGGDIPGTGGPSPVTVVGLTETPKLTGSPPSPSGSGTAEFTLAGPAGVTYECTVDNAAFTACGNPATVSDLADGNRTIRFRALDAWGNPSRETTAFAWTVDISVTRPSLGSSVGAHTNRTWALFTLAGEPDASFECSLDGAAFTGCPASSHVGGLGDGEHRFAARQVSVLGHVSQPTQVDWTVDTTRPAPPDITGQPRPFSPGVEATFAFSGEEPGVTFLCSRDGAGATECASPHGVTHLSEGRHSMDITQVDRAGNQGEASTINWTVDTVAPIAPHFRRAPGVFSGDPDAVIAIAGEPGATFACSRDGGPVAPCDSRQVIGGLPLGRHSLRAQQVDAAGNAGPFAVTSWTTVPTPPPGDRGVSVNEGAIYTTSESVMLDLVWPEGATAVRVSNDGGFRGAQTIALGARVPWTLATSRAERLPRIIYVRFRGHLVDEDRTYTDDIILDGTAPEIIAASVAGDAPEANLQPGTRARTVTIRVQARDRTSGVDGMQVASSRAPRARILRFHPQTRATVTGPRVWVRVRDGAGNWSGWTRART